MQSSLPRHFYLSRVLSLNYFPDNAASDSEKMTDFTSVTYNVVMFFDGSTYLRTSIPH